MKALYVFCLITLTAPVFSQTFDIYVSDAGNFDLPPWQILKFDENGKNPEVFIDNNLAWPQDLIFMEDSNFVLVSNLNSGRINRHDAATGAFISTFASGISGPTRMKIGADNLLYVLQWNGPGHVLRYQLDGTSLGNFTTVGTQRSIGLDWDADGNLYVSSFSQDLVRKYDPEGDDLGVFVSAGLLGPTNIWFDDNGELLVVDYNGTAVKRYNTDGEFVNNFMTGLSQAEGVAFYPNGDILIGNGQNHSVKLYNSEGEYQTDLVSNGTGDLLRPNAVVLREKTTSSIAENPIPENQAIYPTVGDTFFLRDAYFPKVREISIYTSQGTLVTRIQEPGSPFWSADQSGSGNYIIVLQLQDGRRISEQVAVVR